MTTNTLSDGNPSEATWRLGVVSFLNSRPLIAGLEAAPDFSLTFDVPSRLPAMLDGGQVDAALVPVVDMVQPGRNWQVVSDACIGCNGETLTVRVFSRTPPETITTLHVDGDSHTSVMLARILWLEQFGTRLDIVPFHGETSLRECEAVLLIGDKVVSQRLIDFDLETDLGSAWKSMTSLPFVFAVWAAPRELDVSGLAQRLSAARDLGVRTAELIAADFGPAQGFPLEVAKRYLTQRLKFTMGPKQRQGMARFLELANRHQLISADRELVFA